MFRILSWFPGIFQKCFKKKNELMKFNTFDLFELITDVILFNVQIISTLSKGSFFSLWLLSPFDATPNFFNCFLAFYYDKISKLVFYIFCSNLKSSISPRKWYLETHDLMISTVHCYWSYYCFYDISVERSWPYFFFFKKKRHHEFIIIQNLLLQSIT